MALALLIVISVLFAGCGQDKTEAESEATDVAETAQTKETAETEETAENEEVADPFAEHMDISWIVYNQPDIYPIADTPVQQLIEERFNVSLDIVEIDIFNEDEWTLFWASGGMADKIQCNTMGKYIYEFADQGIIRSIDYDWLYEYAPDTMDIVLSLVDENYLKQSVLYEDQLWCLPNAHMLHHSYRTLCISGKAGWIKWE
jgi:hypothetical protein